MRRADVPLPSVALPDASSRPSGPGFPPARRAKEGAQLREICSIFYKNQTNFGSEIGL